MAPRFDFDEGSSSAGGVGASSGASAGAASASEVFFFVARPEALREGASAAGGVSSTVLEGAVPVEPVSACGAGVEASAVLSEGAGAGVSCDVEAEVPSAGVFFADEPLEPFPARFDGASLVPVFSSAVSEPTEVVSGA
ncbi:hypothetical protein D7W81_10460 [Corallococcus aberystwythensis]|uniref:Uncharacterized protein n=1 Tax=Corallococcus aberystwythensis TaxID=2316722 RepID=A0A3A8QTY8_9BACT|nr:hypothetical protein D7W81_10460 [Corallococcus aberystwythensis]